MRISLKVEFPYKEGSAPPACPQNPYNKEIGKVEERPETILDAEDGVDCYALYTG